MHKLAFHSDDKTRALQMLQVSEKEVIMNKLKSYLLLLLYKLRRNHILTNRPTFCECN